MPAPFISPDPTLLDLTALHAFLSTCYWSPGIHRERMERAIAHSLCFGVYDPSVSRVDGKPGPALVGFARVVTDYATYGYLCDVFILESHRGRGLSKSLMREVVAHPSLQGLRRLDLFTRDAHALYKQFGFAPTPDPTRFMERIDREGYKKP